MLSLTHDNVMNLGLKICSARVLTPKQDFEVSLTGDWLQKEEFPRSEFLVADCVSYRYVFPRKAIWDKLGDIVCLLRQLPEEFRYNHPQTRGWPFRYTRIGVLDHKTRAWGTFGSADLLIGMGLAISAAAWVLPRDLWKCLPDSDPLVVLRV